MKPEERVKLIGCLFSGAMVSAPFIGLLYGLEVGLAVLVVALGSTAYLALDASRQADLATQRRLRLLAGVNAALAAVVLVTIVARLL